MMRQFIGNLFFSISFLIWMVGMAIACLPILVLPRKVTTRVAKFWVGVMLSLLRLFARIDYKVEGLENLPQSGGYIVACKHQSAWETFALMRILPDPAIILKRELLSIPFYGWYARKMDHIPVNRQGRMAALKDMIRQAKTKLAHNRQLIIFPQGTRVKPDQKSSKVKYQSGIAALYDQLNVPVVPAALNSGKVWQKGQFIKNSGTITLRFLPPIAPGLSKKKFMERLEKEIEQAVREL